MVPPFEPNWKGQSCPPGQNMQSEPKGTDMGGVVVYIYHTPPPPCISYALVQATVGAVGAETVLIWDLIFIQYQK